MLLDESTIRMRLKDMEKLIRENERMKLALQQLYQEALGASFGVWRHRIARLSRIGLGII